MKIRHFFQRGASSLARLSHTVDLTQGNPRWAVTRFAVPIFLSQLFQQLYNSVDSLIVGNFLGKEALASVSSSGSLIFLLVSFISGTSLGAGVVIARYFGAGEREQVSRAIHTTVALGLVAGTLVSVLGVSLTPHILRWMGTAPDVLPGSIRYFRNYFIGALSVVMYNMCKDVMTALGDSRRPLYYLIVSSLLNIVLDLLFVGVFRFGVGSAATATTIAQTVSALLCLRHLTSRRNEFRVYFRRLRFHRDILRQILRCGVPSGVQNSVIGFANVLVQTNINSFGSDAMAACGAYFKLEGFAFLPITCFSMALTTFIGQNLGAREYDRARQGARFGIVLSCILAEIIGVVMYWNAPFLIGLFNRSPSVVAIGTQEFRTEALFYCMLAFSHCVSGIFRGAGKATVPMAVMLSVWCVLRIAYITVIMRIIHDIQYLFWAYPLTWCISSVIFLLYFLRSDWVHGFETNVRETA